MRDTTPEAERAYWQIVRNMTPQQRVAQAMVLSQRVRDIKRAGIRALHPDLDEQEVHLLLIEALHGKEASEAVRAHLAARNHATTRP
jgi:hypothetical protein